MSAFIYSFVFAIVCFVPQTFGRPTNWITDVTEANFIEPFLGVWKAIVNGKERIFVANVESNGQLDMAFPIYTFDAHFVQRKVDLLHINQANSYQNTVVTNPLIKSVSIKTSKVQCPRFLLNFFNDEQSFSVTFVLKNGRLIEEINGENHTYEKLAGVKPAEILQTLEAKEQ